MASLPVFQCFFSYAHFDAVADPAAVEALSRRLEDLVNQRLANARFKIWRDTEDIRTGARWEPRLEDAVRASHMMIVLVSPRWVESDICRREYATFEDVERAFGCGEYVAPLIVRQTEKQEKHFTKEQVAAHDSLMTRQYRHVVSTEFLQLTPDQRVNILHQIADDLEGMVERLRALDRTRPPPSRENAPRKTLEYNGLPVNFEEFHVAGASDLVLREEEDGVGVYAQFDFHERMFVETTRARVDFGFRRAHVTVPSPEGREIEQIPDLQSAGHVRYMRRKDDPSALCVAIEPPEGKVTLGPLALPVTAGENRLAKIGFISGQPVQDLTGELRVAISSTDVHIFGHAAERMTTNMRRHLELILRIAAAEYIDKHKGPVLRWRLASQRGRRARDA